MKLTKYAQSCFLVETEGKKILIDCGDMVNEEIVNNFRDIDVLLFTHTHNDHCYMDYVKKIFENSNPLIFGNDEIVEKLNEFDVTVVKEGDVNEFDNIKIETTKAVHGYWFLMKDKPLPKPNGFIIRDSTSSVYHCSDTIAFYPQYQADIVLVPICGHGVVMEPDIAVEFCLEMNAKLAVPMHYDNDKHPLGTERFETYSKEKGLNYKVLNNGESFES
jgi:L-ascorbate metabolism protein UlaG (beta-lactamase superfamily)